jgi:hypothetical protein
VVGVHRIILSTPCHEADKIDDPGKSGAEHANDNELVKEAGRRKIYSLLVSGCFTYARRQISYQYLAEAILCSL